MFINGYLISTSRTWFRGHGAPGLGGYLINRVEKDGRWKSGGGKNDVKLDGHKVCYYTKLGFWQNGEQTQYNGTCVSMSFSQKISPNSQMLNLKTHFFCSRIRQKLKEKRRKFK